MVRASTTAWLLCTILATGAWADDGDTASQAFEAGNYTKAETLWQRLADQGSAEAMVGLAMISDYGLGRPVDRKSAFGWYMKAAQAGHVDAQLNVGVMLDSGIGVNRDPDRAFIWYSRSALRGNARAAYNLGLLFENGTGTARNAELARFWFSQAANSLKAAETKIALLTDVGTGIGAPLPAFAEFNGTHAELMWRAQSDTTAASFIVQIAFAPMQGDAAGPIVVSAQTAASAISVPLGRTGPPLFWRVSEINADGTDYVASPWQGLPTGMVDPPGLVSIETDNEFASSVDLALPSLIADLRALGFWVLPLGSVTEKDVLLGAPKLKISYGYASDAKLAISIADRIPSLSLQGVVFDAGAGLQPGQISVVACITCITPTE